MTVATVLESKPIKPSFGNALPHFLPITAFPLILVAAVLGSWWLIGPFVLFMLVSPLDTALGKDNRNMDPKATSDTQLFLYDLPVWLWALLWPITLIFTVWQIFVVGQHAWWESVLLAIILAIEGQAVFIVGHELIHRRNAWERYIGEFLLASGSYPHYATEHFYIHHAYVGTPLDVGSAPKGQSFWRYFPRELLHNLTGSWQMARKRMARRNLPVWHYYNPFWRYGIETAAWYAFFYAIGGWLIVLVYMLLCLGNVFSMKVSNYIQHYGLRRIRLPNGRFEKVQPRHSWSANDKFSKWMFFNYQRHADHHMTASRHYPLLQHYDADASPQLPASQGAMFTLALRPKVWFKTMDPLVDQWREQFYPHIRDWNAYDSRVAEAHPDAFDDIVEIFENSPRLAGAIEKYSELLESLRSREFSDLEIPGGFGPDPQTEAIARRGLVRVYWTHEFGIAEMQEQLAESPVQDSTDAAEIVRNWTNYKTFQIAMHTMRGNLSPSETETALTNIAEAAITTVLSAAFEDIEDRSYQVTNAAFAALAVGDLASKEATARLPLELVLMHDNMNQEIINNLKQRFEETFTILSNNSLLFEPIPEDQEITLYTVDHLPEHFHSKDGVDGLLKLTRSRWIYIAGDPAIQKKVETFRNEYLANNSNRDSLIDHLIGRMNSTEFNDSTPFEAAEWGMERIECVARILQLTHFSVFEASENSVVPSAASIFEFAVSKSILDSESGDELARIAQFWRNLVGIQRLVLNDDSDSNVLNDSLRSVLATACDQSDYDELNKEIHHAIEVTQRCDTMALVRDK